MKNLKLSKTRIATIILAILLVSSTYTILSAAAQIDTSKIDIKTNANSQKLNPETGQPYGDLSQYEWKAVGADGANTRHTDGPVPDHPQVLWSVARSGSGIPSAFNGMVFIRVTSTVYALNATTGALATGWPTTGAVGSGSAPGFGSNGAVVKINDQIGSWLATNGPNFFNISNGYVYPKPTIAGDGWTTLGTAGVAMYWGMMYSPEDQCYISVASNANNGKTIGLCIDCTDPIGRGAFLRWQVDFDTGLEAMGFGGGNAYFGGYGEGLLWAVDMVSGQILWRAYKQGNVGYSTTYYDGSVYHSASSTQITRFDSKTGAVLATFDVIGGRAFYVYGMSAQYGRIFAHSIEVPQGWIGGFDCKTLEQQWKYPAYYYIAYLVGACGDRKFLIVTSDVAKGSPVPGYPDSKSPGFAITAVDAFTGKFVWSITTSSATYGECLAYGNLYFQNGGNVVCYSDLAGDQGASAQTGWPFFHGPINANGTSYGIATGNYPSNVKTAAWKFQANLGVSGSPIAVNGKVYFGSWGGNLYCLDAYKGTQIWSNQYDCRILSTPAYDNGTIYTGADDGYCYALDPNTGATIWKANAGLLNSEAVQQEAWQARNSPIVWNSTYVIVGGNDGQLYCFDAKTGATLWTNAVSSYAVGIAGTCAIHKDLLNRTCVYLMCAAKLFKIDINGTTITSVGIGTSRASCCTPVIVPTPYGDLMFVTYGSGSTAYLRCYNDTTMTTVGSGGSLNLGGSSVMTPLVQTVTYVPSQLCMWQNGTNLGTVASSGTGNRGGPNVYRINFTDTAYHDAPGWSFPCVYVAESTQAACWALVGNGTNLGGVGNANQFLLNYTTAGMTFNLTRVWGNWAGHQVFSSSTVAIPSTNPSCPIDYIGNAAYGFTAYNGTTGAVLSTFSAAAQVFSTAALWQDWVYMTGNDGYCYAFTGSTQGVTTIFADSNKGDTMLVNEATVIEGSLSTTSYFESTYDHNNNATFGHVEVPYANVTLVWVNQDGTSEQVVTSTDYQGNFNFTYTPAKSGTAQWLCFFDGSVAPDGVALSQAYSSYKTMNVIGAPVTTPTTETPTPTPVTGVPIEYIYAIIGIIVALIVIVAVVMLLRNRKK